MPISKKYFSEHIVKWYHLHKRDLPWRHTKDPYKIWLSEIMLQQTRVDQGLPYYLKFVQKYPTVQQFAAADEDQILHMWEGLGYYSRARNMLKTARIINSELQGKFPDNYDDLILLPGIGPYSAAAISSICYDESRAVVDGNVIRVLSRIFAITEDAKTSVGKKLFNNTAQKLIPKKNVGDYNQAIMEYGARHCTPKNPDCEPCMFRKKCEAYKHGMQSEWPIKSKKINRTKRYLHYYVSTKKGQVLLQKRKDQDIYKGLYQLPLIEQVVRPTIKTVRLHFSKYNITNISKIEDLKIELDQVLSHQKIIARFYLIHGDWCWNSQNESSELILVNNPSKFAMPRILRRFFSKFEVI